MASRSWLGIVLLAGMAAGWLILRSGGTNGLESDVAPPIEDTVLPLAPLPPRAESSALRRVEPDRDAPREPAPAGVLEVVAVDPAGAPVGGVTVTCTPLEGVGTQSGTHWSVRDWDEVGAQSLADLTDERGRAVLHPAESDRDVRFALWVTAPERLAGWRILDGATHGPHELRLEACEPLRVRVVDSEGRAVSGARLRHMGRRSQGDLPELGEASAVFLRDLATDENGEAMLGLHPAATVVRASLGRLESAPALLEPRQGGSVVLTLRTSFGAGGRVANLGGRAKGPGGSVSCFDLTDGERRMLAQHGVGPDGSWGPATLAWRAEGSYLFRLEGGELLTEERRILKPAEGAYVTVDFDAKPGLAVPVHVTQAEGAEAGAAIADARVGVVWREEGQWIWSFAQTDEAGNALVPGCGGGTCWVRGSKSGHVTRQLGPIELPLANGEAVELALHKAGIVRGVCTSGGEPVEEFSVVFWQGEPTSPSKARFEGRSQGDFEILEAPLGQVFLTAMAPGLPECAAVEVFTTPDLPAEVVLELPPPVSGTGRVVDAVTQEPVADAYVLPWATHAGLLLAPREPRLAVAPDGSFRIEGLPPVDARIEVAAPGYADTHPTGTLSASGEIDFGVVSLSPTQRLEVRLEATRPMDVSEAGFQADSPTAIPYTSFPDDGVLVFDEVEPGVAFLYLIFSDWSTLGHFPRLMPGREWKVSFPYEREPRTSIEVIASGDLELSSDWLVSLHFRDRGGKYFLRTLGLPADGRLEATYAPADELEVDVTDGQGRRLGVTHARFGPNEPRHVTIVVGDRELRLRCLDREGGPLSGTTVWLSSPREEGSFMIVQYSSASGEIVLGALDYSRLIVSASHPRAGLLVGAELELDPEGDTTHELVLDGSGDLRVRLQDRNVPLPGVSVGLFPATSEQWLENRLTGASGTATWGRVSPGSIRIEVEHPGLWPAEREFNFGGGSEPLDIQVRRRGGGEWTILTAEGQPLAAAPVSLRSIEFEVDVAEWMASGELAAAPLATDAAGRIRLEGLPNGPYVLQLVLPSGEPWGTTVEVPPHATAVATLRAPG